jgi:hypothetical protein
MGTHDVRAARVERDINGERQVHTGGRNLRWG